MTYLLIIKSIRMLQEFLVNLFLGEGHPFINCQSAVIPWVVLLEQHLKLFAARNRQFVLQRSCQTLFHHGAKLIHLDDSVLVGVVVCEDLQHVPVQLNRFRAARVSNSFLDEFLVLFNTSLVNDGVRIQGGCLGSNVFPGKLQPFVKGYDTSGFQIHRVKHLLPCCILLSFSFVQLRVCRSVSVSPWQSCCSIDQLGEGGLADESVFVGIGINKQLQEGMVHLSVRVTFLVVDCLLDEPDEVLLGLVEGVYSCGVGRHDLQLMKL